MSVAVWKTILTLGKVCAVLFIVGSGLLFWGHTREMGTAWSAPDFSPPVTHMRAPVAETKALSIPLGRFQKERGPVEEAPKDEPKPAIASVLANLGEIIGAIVIYPPYEEGGFAPAINFKWKQKPNPEEGDVRTIRLGEALVERPDGPNRGTPLNYQFVGCERDPANPGFTYFLFDMKCDGTDVQKVHWKLEEPKKEEKPTEPAATGPGGVSTDKAYVGPRLSSKGPGKPAEPEQVQPVAPQPPPEPVTVEQEPPTGTFFEEEEGVFLPTAEGVDYLERNYERILEETRTESYRDRDGRTGVRVVGIANSSVANQFGIRKDDVILKINDNQVTNQSDAVNVIKSELKKKVNIIKVTIRRAGREIVKTYDTRDPATRRAAKSLGKR
jgi:PDZ domain